MAEIRVNATGAVKFYDNDDSNFVGLQAGSISSDVTFTLPTADGSNGQALTTNGSGALSFSTISSNTPSSADGQALGSTSAEWSDLFLADGGIIYFGNDQDVTLTHDPDDGLFLKSIATADNNPVLLTLQTGETDMAADDVIGKIAFQAPDEGTGTDAILVSGAIQAVAEGDHSSSSNATRLEFMTGASEAATAKMSISSGGIVGMGAVPTGDLGTGLHIKTADSGASVSANADELVIEGSGNAGITIASGNTSGGNIFFADDGGVQRGKVAYDHNADSMTLRSGNNDSLIIDSAGHVTKPLQPSFHCVKNGTASDVTGDGTVYTIAGWTETIDRNADFNNTSGVFTAPVTGLYLLTVTIYIQGFTTSHADNSVYFYSSNRNYNLLGVTTQSHSGHTGDYVVTGSQIVDMDASDTVSVRMDYRSDNKTIDVHSSTKFMGMLLA
jgi:hypothetical protein